MFIVNTLGKFQIIHDDVVLDDDGIRSPMVTKLLLFMLAHREQTLTTDEISVALWQEEEVDNPANALKNLMYRLRATLKKYFGDVEFITTSRGSYCWNSEIELKVDAEQFKELINMAKEEEGENNALAICYYEEAIRLYQGDFMPKLVELHWVVTLNTYYHSMYLSAIKGLAELYIEAKMFDELENICNEALTIDNVDEQLHYYLIYARVKNHKQQLAMQSYEKACEILNKELGVRNSEKLQEIYEEILKMSKATEAEKIENVQEDITEVGVEGVFFCGYPVFREIYRLEARKMARMGGMEYVLLLTVKQKGAVVNSVKQVENFRVKKAMEALEQIIDRSLRIGDVAAKYSDSQYIILLPTCTYDAGMQVAERIVTKFHRKNPSYSNVEIEINLEEVVAASVIVK